MLALSAFLLLVGPRYFPLASCSLLYSLTVVGIDVSIVFVSLFWVKYEKKLCILFQADVLNVKDAICSAMDVMQAMASSICLLLPKVYFVCLLFPCRFHGCQIRMFAYKLLLESMHLPTCILIMVVRYQGLFSTLIPESLTKNQNLTVLSCVTANSERRLQIVSLLPNVAWCDTSGQFEYIN